MKNLINKFFNDESGAAALEYGILIAVVAGVVLVTLSTLGTTLAGEVTAANTAVGAL
jgi:pilus assembly protein Flp/PilA